MDYFVYPGPAFYLTLISLPLLFFSALTVCCGWRKEKHGDALPSSYGSSTGGNRFGRFKFGRNKNSNGSYGGGEKIPLQSSRQRVLDAFQSDGNKVWSASCTDDPKEIEMIPWFFHLFLQYHELCKWRIVIWLKGAMTSESTTLKWMRYKNTLFLEVWVLGRYRKIMERKLSFH